MINHTHNHHHPVSEQNHVVAPLWKRSLLFLQHHLWSILLTFITFVIAVVNYRFGSNLVGWDNIYSELNFPAAFRMNLFSTWQEYRGLGVQDVLSHGANLVHTTLLWLLHWVLPQSLLRYTYHFLCLYLGAAGMYILLSRSFHKHKVLAFTGALFYQLNLITIQMFYAPLEVFSTHFAVLPWLAYLILRFLRHRTLHNLLLLVLGSLLATPQGFVPTVFIAYCTLVGSLLLVELLRFRLQAVGRCAVVMGVLLITNAFWLLPFLHAAVYQGSTVKNTKINQMSSENIFEKNKQYGDAIDVLFQRGFMLDIVESDLQGQQRFIMEPWKNHISQPAIVVLTVFFAGLLITGVYVVGRRLVVKRRFRTEDYFFPLLLISFFMLGTRVPVLGTINEFMRDTLPLFGEAFRFPFTKFSLVFVLCYSIFLTEGLQVLSAHLVHRFQNTRWHTWVTEQMFSGIVAACIILYALPVLSGNLFYNVVRLPIPQDYQQIIAYFQEEPTDRRVMTLPQTSFWNWLYYSWGARGSGFLWYGIEQATLERPFDPWSNYNEQYLNELFYSIEYNDSKLFAQIIDKYDISYILLDEYLEHRGNMQERASLEEFFEEANIEIVETRQFGKLSVYKLREQPYVALQSTVAPVGSPFNYDSIDRAFAYSGAYTWNETAWDTYHLFPTLFTNKTQEDLEFTITEDTSDGTISLTTNGSPYFVEGEEYRLKIDTFTDTEQMVPALIKFDRRSITVAPPDVTLSVGGRSYPLELFPEQRFSLNGTQVEQIFVNGDPVGTASAQVGYFYPNAINSLSIRTPDGDAPSVGVSLDLRERPVSTVLKEPLNDKAVSITISNLRPYPWNGENILIEKTYVIDAPCVEEIRRGRSLYEERPDGSSFTLLAQGSTTCAHQYLSGVPQNLGTLIRYSIDNVSGKDISVHIDNPQKEIVFAETLLNGPGFDKSVILPPTSQYETEDYGTHFLVESAGETETKAMINSMSVSSLPYWWIRSMRLVREDATPIAAGNRSREAAVAYTHPVKSHYIVPLSAEMRAFLAEEQNMLSLSQSYHDGWKAYLVDGSNPLASALPFFLGNELGDKHKLNNWAQAWALSPEELAAAGTEYGPEPAVVMVFWPQYLQLAGFLVLVGGLSGILAIVVVQRVVRRRG